MLEMETQLNQHSGRMAKQLEDISRRIQVSEETMDIVTSISQ